MQCARSCHTWRHLGVALDEENVEHAEDAVPRQAVDEDAQEPVGAEEREVKAEGAQLRAHLRDLLRGVLLQHCLVDAEGRMSQSTARAIAVVSIWTSAPEP